MGPSRRPLLLAVVSAVLLLIVAAQVGARELANPGSANASEGGAAVSEIPAGGDAGGRPGSQGPVPAGHTTGVPTSEAAAAIFTQAHMTGAAAAAAVGPARLAQAATEVGWSSEQLEAQLETDAALKYDTGSGKLLYACSFPNAHRLPATATGPAAAGAAGVPSGEADPQQTAPAGQQPDPPISEAFILHRCERMRTGRTKTN